MIEVLTETFNISTKARDIFYKISKCLPSFRDFDQIYGYFDQNIQDFDQKVGDALHNVRYFIRNLWKTALF